MAWTKLKTAVVAGAIVIMAAGTATVVMHVVKTPDNPIKASAKSSPFTFAGYATPEDSIQSLLWLAGKGDFEAFEANMIPIEMERFKNKMAGRSEDEMRRKAIAMANAMVGYKLTQKDVISADEVHLHISARPSDDGLHDGSVIISMKKIGNEWKAAGEVR